MIISLQYCKLTRQQNETAKELMGHYRINANEFGYKEKEDWKKLHKCYKWWYDDQDNKGANNNWEDKWKDLCTIVVLGQKIWGTESSEEILDITKESNVWWHKKE